MNYIGCPMEIAKKYGVEGGIMLQNLYFWISKNKANGKHFHDGRYWTYNSTKAFAELFPCWSEKQIRRILNNLKKAGAIHVGNYNKNPYDHTTWYALDESVLKIFDPDFEEEKKPVVEDFSIREKGDFQMGKSKKPNGQTYTRYNTNINTYINKKNKKEKEFFWKKSGVVNQVHQGSEQKTSYNLDELLMKSGLYLP